MWAWIVKLIKGILKYANKSFWRNAGFSRGFISFGKKLLSRQGFKIAVQSWAKKWITDNIPFYKYYRQYKEGEWAREKGFNTSGISRIMKRLVINKLTPIEIRKMYYLYGDIKGLKKSMNKMIEDYKKARQPKTALERTILNSEINEIKKGIKPKDLKKGADEFFKSQKITLEDNDNNDKTADYLSKFQHSLSTKEMNEYLQKTNANIKFTPFSPTTQNFSYEFVYNTKDQTLLCQVRGGFITGQETKEELDWKLAIADAYGWNPKTINKQDVEINIIIKALRSTDFGKEIWHGMGLKNY